MNTLQILIIALPLCALAATLLLLIYGTSETEVTQTGSDFDIDKSAVKPKRRYKKRKKKVVTTPVHAPVQEAPVTKRPVGRPKKSN